MSTINTLHLWNLPMIRKFQCHLENIFFFTQFMHQISDLTSPHVCRFGCSYVSITITQKNSTQTAAGCQLWISFSKSSFIHWPAAQKYEITTTKLLEIIPRRGQRTLPHILNVSSPGVFRFQPWKVLRYKACFRNIGCVSSLDSSISVHVQLERLIKFRSHDFYERYRIYIN